MSYETLIVERRGPVGWLIFNRPKALNAMNADDALNRDIGELARLLRVLSGMYDQAARAAASL